MQGDKYRILNRFSPLVRIALRGFKFNKPEYNGYVCGTGRCPLAVAIELSGGKLDSLTPGAYSIAMSMYNSGVISATDFDNVKKEASDFVNNYSSRNYTWKKYL